MRSLLDRYTVVLVGYQAEDPPVKYLLQGLNHDGLSDGSRLFAFDKGTQKEVRDKWLDRGVTAISFRDFPDLWQSLEAWADRADDPKGWRSKVIEMSMKGPRKVSDYERGQVAHLVRTAPGAREFAKAEPVPPAEWLCVFDALCRSAEPYKGIGEDDESFDPLQSYGLDDDPPRIPKGTIYGGWEGDNVLEWRRGDANPPDAHRLGRRPAEIFDELPPRLRHLSKWIVSKVASPVTAWWAVRQKRIHPWLREQLKLELLRNKEIHDEARRFWELFFEHISDARNYGLRGDWFDLKEKINRDGWSLSSLRRFEEFTAPMLKCNRPSGIGRVRPPLSGWDEIELQEIASWDVEFPERHGEELAIPDEALESAFGILDGNLRKAVNWLEEINYVFFSPPTCYPTREVPGELPERDETFYWFLELFDRLAEFMPGNALARVALWPDDAPYFFRGLKLYSWNRSEVFRADEAAWMLLGLCQEIFWCCEVRREILFLINDRWDGFSSAYRAALLDRILAGPDLLDQFGAEIPTKCSQDELVCCYLQWLRLQGKELPQAAIDQLERKISGIPDWNERRAEHLTEYNSIQSFSISVVEDPDSLIQLPVGMIAEQAKPKHQADPFARVDNRPFNGLVKESPRKALASLSYAARQGDFPEVLWRALLHNWPASAPPRLFNTLLERLGRLPKETIRDLGSPVGQWLEKWFCVAFQENRIRAWRIFDHLLEGILLVAPDEEKVGPQRCNKDKSSRSTYGRAINRPVGMVTQGVLHALGALKLDHTQGIPEAFKARLEWLLSVPSENKKHALSIITFQLNWLYLIDPRWVKEQVTPAFELDHPDAPAAWNGYFSSARIAPKELFSIIKPLFLLVLPYIYSWGWAEDMGRIAAQMVVELAISQDREDGGLTPREARRCIRMMTDSNRKDSIEHLGRIGQRAEDSWPARVVPFIENVWPRDRVLKTPSLTKSWVSLLEKTDSEFMMVLGSVRKFLVPVKRESHWLYSFSRAARGDWPVTVKYPEGVLILLDAVVPNLPEDVPYELSQVLDLIEESESKLAGDKRFLRLQNLVEST